MPPRRPAFPKFGAHTFNVAKLKRPKTWYTAQRPSEKAKQDKAEVAMMEAHWDSNYEALGIAPPETETSG